MGCTDIKICLLRFAHSLTLRTIILKANSKIKKKIIIIIK
jgi:hypothetical protein